MDRWLGSGVVVGFMVFIHAFPPHALAKRPYGRAGCGLGSIVHGPSGNQSMAVTTNSTSGSQLFGITSGTSNCTPTGNNYKVALQENFIIANLANVSKEIARGQGETLEAFVGTFGCDPGSIPAVAHELKGSYSTIFAAPGALAVLDACREVLLENPTLAQSCRYLEETPPST